MTVDDLTSPADAPATTQPGVTSSGLWHALRDLLPFLVLFVTFASLTWHASRPMTNTDTYFHLRFGEEFLSGHWSLRHPGSPTTFGTNDWVPTQWLPQVAMAWTEEHLGLAGVAWLQGLLHLGLALSLWFAARRYAGPITSAALVALALTAASPGLSMRPQVISYLLVVVTTAAWLRSRDDGRPRWWLVPVTWVWAMSHGMWPVGLVIGAVAVAGIAADRTVDRRGALRLALVPVLSAVAAALTPVGPKLYPAVLLVGSRGKYFAEWQPAHFLRLAGGTFVVLAGIVLVRMVRRRAPASWTETLLFGLACAWALYTTRTVAVGAMMLVPIGARGLGELMPRLRRAGKVEVGVVLGGVVASLVALALAVPSTADTGIADPPFARQLDQLPAGTTVVNDWGKGGWFMWRWPKLDFVVNGYGDLYTDAELDRNFRLDSTDPGWVAAVQETGARYALLDPGSRLAYGLQNLESWQLLDRDADLVLLKAPAGWPAG